MTDKCSEIRDAIALEGNAPENKESQKHLAECEECARFLQSVLAVEQELGSLAPADVDDVVVDKLLSRPELSAQAGSHKLRWAVGLAAAAMIAFVATRVTLMGQKQQQPDFEVAIVQNGNKRSGEGSQIEGDDSSVERRKSLESLGYIGGARDTDGVEEQLRDDRGMRDNVFLVPSNEAEAEDDEKLEDRLQELNRTNYARRGNAGLVEDTDRALLESKNEPMKKDAKQSGAGSAVAAASPEAEAVASPKRPAVAGRVDGPASPADTQEIESYAETVVVMGATPSIDVKEGVSEEASLDKAQIATDEFRSRLVGQDVAGAFYQRAPEPEKLIHVDAAYPEAAKAKRVAGTVVVRVLIDRDGNVTEAIVVDSVEGLDQAAIDAVMQWKYEASEEDQRTTTVGIAFDVPSAPNDGARLFLEERDRIDNLRFRDARGYWANTYLPGDPKARFLAMRLRNNQQFVAPHRSARPVVQPFDAPSRAALSVTLHADHRGVSRAQRMLVQVGVKATENYGRRRPPMNVGIVLDADPNDLASARALVESLQQAKALGDRFRLILPGKGEVVAPEAFRHGSLSVALDELDASNRSTDLQSAVRLAVERVHAGDDPTMPLGSSLVLVVTPKKLGSELDELAQLAHQSAIGGVPVSVVGVGAGIDRDELARLALSGQGRRYFLEQPEDATGIVDRELAASSRVVARALRLRIKLAAGVRLVDVIGSESLSERQAERVREAEKSIDLRLSRNLGIEADRGEDEDGIQIVIPSFYAGDTHTILLDVVVARAGAIAEVTARYKDLAELRNTVAKASLSLPRSEAEPGPLETNVLKNYLSWHLSEELENAADELERGSREAAVVRLNETRDLLAGFALGNDSELERDIAMLDQYIGALSASLEPAFVSYLADSLRYAGASKRRLPAALT